MSKQRDSHDTGESLPEDRREAARATADRLRAEASSLRSGLSVSQRGLLADRLRRLGKQAPAGDEIPRRPQGEPVPLS
ncbi:MAG: hypothetical protein GY856_04595, partial [bacterium]|nr:hypothetical protein [bacterium]